MRRSSGFSDHGLATARGRSPNSATAHLDRESVHLPVDGAPNRSIRAMQSRRRHPAGARQRRAHRLPASTRPRPSDHHDASLFQPRRSRHAPTVAPVDQRAVLPIRPRQYEQRRCQYASVVAVERRTRHLRPRSSNHPGKQRQPGPDAVRRRQAGSAHSPPGPARPRRSVRRPPVGQSCRSAPILASVPRSGDRASFASPRGERVVSRSCMEDHRLARSKQERG